MPIYEFECSACAHRFERLQKLSDADPTECPVCGKSPVRRCVTAPSFRLAGSGWYETDFKKEGDVKRNLVSKDESKKGDTSKPDAVSAGNAEPSGKQSPADTPSTTPAAAAKPSASDSSASST